jgi:acetyltransferase-like isoleucine patch superfamily enzyme
MGKVDPNYVGVGTYGYQKVKVAWRPKCAPANYLTIGKYCSIASGVQIWLGGDHKVDWISTYPFGPKHGGPKIRGWPHSKGPVRIGNDVWIGNGATIMHGVTIGDGSVIGAKAVVARDVDPYTVVVGNPAKEVRKRFSDEDIEFLLDLKWWDWEGEVLTNAMPILCSADLTELREYARGLK